MSLLRNMLKISKFLFMQYADSFQIEGLRVVVWQNDDGWMAQGLEIDYAAGGVSIDDVMERFATGLALTLRENQKAFGTVDRVLKPAPEELWKPFLNGQAQPPNSRLYREKLHKALEELAQVELLPKHLTPIQLYQRAA